MLCVSFAYLGAGVIVHCLLVDAVSFGNLTDGESISAQSLYLFDLLNGELATRVCSHLSQSGKRVQDIAHCGGAMMNENGDLICRYALPGILADLLFLIIFQTRREWHIINPFCIIIRFCAICTTILTDGRGLLAELVQLFVKHLLRVLCVAHQSVPHPFIQPVVRLEHVVVDCLCGAVAVHSL